MADVDSLVISSQVAEWTLGASTLQVREQGVATADDRLVSQVGIDTWNQLGITVRRRPQDNNWTIRSSDVVGVAQLTIAGKRSHVQILPKINGLDLFFLADWAYGTAAAVRPLPGERAHLDAVRDEPAACLLGWYVRELSRFASRWIRRGYESREEDLLGRVRGRVNMQRYIARSLALGRAHVVPSRFAEASHDTPANRFLKAGLTQVAVLVNTLPVPAARTALREMTRQALSLFATVSDTRAIPRDALRLNLNGPMRHYRPLVALTQSLLMGSYLSTDVGGHSQEAIVWSVNDLYEEALRGVLAQWPSATSCVRIGRSSVVALDGTILGSSVVKPDFVLSAGDGRTLILDAKYKDVGATARWSASGGGDDVALNVGRGPRIVVRRSDVYQAVAYAQHKQWRGSAVGLIYPVALGLGDAYPQPVVIPEFSPVVQVLFFDVGPLAASNLPAFYAALDSLQ